MDARRWHRLAVWTARGEEAIDVGAGVRGEVAGGVVTLGRTVETPTPVRPEAVPLAIPGEAAWMGGRVVATVADAGDPVASPALVERLDLDRLVPPLVVDSPRPGDRFDPLGLGGHSMPLADFLRGRRVPRAGRPGVPLVRDAAGIVWVVGHRIGHRARLTGATRRVATLEFVGPARAGRVMTRRDP
jgi:tRNA(Ile)-lysidine synthase